MWRSLAVFLTLACLACGSHATAPCPQGAQCSLAGEFTGALVASAMALQKACSQADPAHADRYQAVFSQWFPDDDNIVADARKSPGFADILKSMEAAVAEMDKDALKRECAAQLLAPKPIPLN
jgi:hypothetical protein